jgi:peptidoglycan/LPS O-acetylase OafA/YrhL
MIVETFSALVILAIALIFLNPGHLAMPDNMVTMLVVGMVVAFLSFAALLLREKSNDEREQAHILMAGRISYLVGVGTLICGIIVQSLKHEIDSWLVVSLCMMVFSKLVSRIYSGLRM